MTTADASQVMQNFNDILNGVSDGTKDLSINALTVAGTATLNGAINLGNSSADDITVTGSLASTIPIKTTNSYDIGSSTLGLRALYFGANSQTTKIQGSSSMAATYTLTLPTNVPDGSDYVLKSTTGGVLSFTHPGPLGESGSDADTTLTLSSKRVQIVTPTANTRVYTLPTTSVKAGDIWTFVNNAAVSSSNLYYTIKSSGGNTVLTLFPQTTMSIVALQDTPTTAAHWCGISTAMSNWTAYTPTYTGLGTTTNDAAEFRRFGDSLHLKGSTTCGTVAASLFSITLPMSLTIDSAKLSISSNTTSNPGNLVGHIGMDDSATSTGSVLVLAPGTSTSLIYAGHRIGVSSHLLTPQNGNSLFANSSVLAWEAVIPISGWDNCRG